MSAEVLASLQFFFFERQRFLTHLITRSKTGWNVNLMIYLLDTFMSGDGLLDDIATSIG